MILVTIKLLNLYTMYDCLVTSTLNIYSHQTTDKRLYKVERGGTLILYSLVTMASYCFVLILFLSAVVAKDPLVTLNHGGQLQGKTFDYDGVNVDLFLGKLADYHFQSSYLKYLTVY